MRVRSKKYQYEIYSNRLIVSIVGSNSSMKDGPYNRIDSELGIMAKKGKIANLPR